MFFCDNDDNMLYIKIADDNSLVYYCKLCGEEYKISDLEQDEKSRNCVYKQNYQTKNYSYKTFINKNMFKDPTLPRIKDIKCPYEECESNTQGKDKEVIYLKYNTQDMAFLYCCTLCEKKWTSSNVKLD
jgi:DNA-directed RNA polymerase subunit M/transcription elongation factor TFIIS